MRVRSTSSVWFSPSSSETATRTTNWRGVMDPTALLAKSFPAACSA